MLANAHPTRHAAHLVILIFELDPIGSHRAAWIGRSADLDAIAERAGAGGGEPADAVACLAVNVRPATDTVPSRALPPFVPIVNPTVALAVPLEPLEIEIHGRTLPAVQGHPASVVTVKERLPPAAPIEASAGAIAYVQGAAA
jgi:hypothetical protein